MKKLILSVLLFPMTSLAFAQLTVITTTEDTAAIAREIGGDKITIESLSRGYMDPHFIDAKPSHLLKLKKADVYIQIGLELEVGWAPSLLTSARNPKILPGTKGFLDASQGCLILQQTTGRVDRSLGDVHPFGNPHFWLDPDNGLVIAKSIEKKLSELDPVNAGTYQANLSSFEARLKIKQEEWKRLLAESGKIRVVTYHNSWPNFADHFGIEIANYIEPRAGIPPSPRHVEALTAQIKSERISEIWVEPYFDTKLPEKIAKETGSRLVILAPSVGADPAIKTYFDLFDHNLSLIKKAAGKTLQN
jgi:zinc/manganese transport system substrate-binding protein